MKNTTEHNLYENIDLKNRTATNKIEIQQELDSSD
jgi:hypothetical protein